MFAGEGTYATSADHNTGAGAQNSNPEDLSGLNGVLGDTLLSNAHVENLIS